MVKHLSGSDYENNQIYDVTEVKTRGGLRYSDNGTGRGDLGYTTWNDGTNPYGGAMEFYSSENATNPGYVNYVAGNAAANARWQFISHSAGNAYEVEAWINQDGSAVFTGDVAVPDSAYGSGWNGNFSVPTKNAIYDKIETLGSGGTVNVNTTYGSQKNLTSSGLTALTGAVDGSNTAFTVPEAIYGAGTLQVFLNGVLQPLGDAITETTPASGVFNFITAPVTGDQIVVSYQKFSAGTGPFVQSLTAGTNITIDSTNPTNPIISASGGGGTPAIVTGDSGTIKTNVAASHGADNIYIDGPTGSTTPYTQLVTRQSMGLYANTGADGLGAWDADIVIGTDNYGNHGVTLDALATGGQISLVAENGVQIWSPLSSFKASLKTDNITANRTLQFPDTSGTLLTASDGNLTLPAAAGTGTGSISIHGEGNTGDNTERIVATGKASLEASTGITISSETGTISLGAGGGVNVTSDLHVDNIVEKTTATGVTIDGVLLKDGLVQPRIGTTTSSATPAPLASSHDQYNITALAANATFSSPGTGVDGQKLMIRIKDNGTARTLTWNAIYIAGPAPLLTTTVISKTHMIGFIYDAVAAKWVCVASDAVGY